MIKYRIQLSSFLIFYRYQSVITTVSDEMAIDTEAAAMQAKANARLELIMSYINHEHSHVGNLDTSNKNRCTASCKYVEAISKT